MDSVVLFAWQLPCLNPGPRELEKPTTSPKGRLICNVNRVVRVNVEAYMPKSRLAWSGEAVKPMRANLSLILSFLQDCSLYYFACEVWYKGGSNRNNKEERPKENDCTTHCPNARTVYRMAFCEETRALGNAYIFGKHTFGIFVEKRRGQYHSSERKPQNGGASTLSAQPCCRHYSNGAAKSRNMRAVS